MVGNNLRHVQTIGPCDSTTYIRKHIIIENQKEKLINYTIVQVNNEWRM